MIKGTIIVRAIWDDEAQVFVATSNDVPGLVAEGATWQEVQKKLNVLIPELLEINSDEGENSGNKENRIEREIPVVLMSEQVSKIRTKAYG